MKMLYEILLQDQSLAHEIRRFLEEAVAIRVQNVTDYLVANEEGVLKTLRSFPSILPPFPFVWMEGTRSKAAGTTNSESITEGCLLIRQSANNPDAFPVPNELRMVGAQWIMSAFYFVRFNDIANLHHHGISLDKAGFPACIAHIPLDEYGVPAHDQDHGICCRLQLNDMMTKEAAKHGERGNEEILTHFVSFFFALSLMHCKNVLIEEVDPANDGQKKRRNRHQRPSISYRVLKIKPMFRTKGTGALVGGSKPSMHIRRGHFKDYRNSEGLFGKYKDLFWWESTVVAREAKSQVVKSYEVSVPDENYLDQSDVENL